ncbi:MAG: ABC transporter permease [Acidimicrobiia bacterium]|nr:ABC transporter permease [Acidimicrobiia bacterium]
MAQDAETGAERGTRASLRPPSDGRVNHLSALAALHLVTIFVLVSLVFFLPRALPGDPLNALLDPEVGGTFTAEARAELEAHYQLDRPLGEQYVRYLGRMATLDFGWSISRQSPVSSLIAARLPWTLLLMGLALTFAAAISWLAGTTSAWRRGSRSDRALVAVLTLARSVPDFAIATILLIVFAVLVPVLPVAGNRTVFAQYTSIWQEAGDVTAHLILPVSALTIGLLGSKFLLVRNSVIGSLGQEYMMLARAKGLPIRVQKYRHAGRNALLPFLTLLGVQFGFAVGGSIFVEEVFTYPGMGTLILDAVDARDYPLLEAVFLVLAATVLMANFVVDLIYTWLDPGVSTGARS